ncbi:hypothetical protein U1Q18_028549, partial [Sarracenia purpurea var. burkii]
KKHCTHAPLNMVIVLEFQLKENYWNQSTSSSIEAVCKLSIVTNSEEKWRAQQTAPLTGTPSSRRALGAFNSKMGPTLGWPDMFTA